MNLLIRIQPSSQPLEPNYKSIIYNSFIYQIAMLKKICLKIS